MLQLQERESDRDLETSLRFYVDKLGFELIADRRLLAPDDLASGHPLGG